MKTGVSQTYKITQKWKIKIRDQNLFFALAIHLTTFPHHEGFFFFLICTFCGNICHMGVWYGDWCSKFASENVFTSILCQEIQCPCSCNSQNFWKRVQPSFKIPWFESVKILHSILMPFLITFSFYFSLLREIHLLEKFPTLVRNWKYWWTFAFWNYQNFQPKNAALGKKYFGWSWIQSSCPNYQNWQWIQNGKLVSF